MRDSGRVPRVLVALQVILVLCVAGLELRVRHLARLLEAQGAAVARLAMIEDGRRDALPQP